MIRREEPRKEEPVDRIRKAHSLVTQAAACWHAGNIGAVEESLAALEGSVVQLRAFEAAVAEPVNSLTGFRNLTGVRNEILRMKDEVAGLERLSNLAARFLGGSPESCGDSPLYGVGGLAESDYSFRAQTFIQA
ncbi:MAG TPA: hypothetical protein VHY84_18900 [Bryobacteraceae bacterium]|jgi:hypothetical protein|nr:hypothetical protein [Bryobacteraceae bacterium]